MEEITIKDLLIKTANDLGKVSIPAELANDVARPVWQAIQNIRLCIDAIPDPKPEEEVKDNV